MEMNYRDYLFYNHNHKIKAMDLVFEYHAAIAIRPALFSFQNFLVKEIAARWVPG